MDLATALTEVHRVFGRRRLQPRFADRCSPVGDRREMAARLERDPRLMPELAVYAFKATLTMGDEEDLLFFTPYCLEVSTRDDEWWQHTTNLYEKLAKIALAADERAAIRRLIDVWWRTLEPWRAAELAIEASAFLTLPEVSEDMPANERALVATLAAQYPTSVRVIDEWLGSDRTLDVLTRIYVREPSEALRDAVERLEAER